MIKLVRVLFAILISSTCYSQKLKTYSGVYDIKSDYVDIGLPIRLIKGTATYTYFEDENLNRIRTGLFNYTGNLSNNGYLLSISITGNYSNNIKDGKWQVKLSITSGKGTSVSTNFNGIFKNGLPNGLWTSICSINEKGKSLTTAHSIVFDNNTTQGEFKMTNSNGNENITGYLDKTGYFTGKTIVKKNGKEYQLTFKQGLLLSIIGRNLQDGEIFRNDKYNDSQISSINQLLTVKDSSILYEIPYTIVDGENKFVDELVTNEFKKTFKTTSFFDATPGDLSIDKSKINQFLLDYNWIGFKTRILVEIETKSEKTKKLQKYNDLVQRADSQFENFRFNEAKSIYNDAKNLILNEDYPKNRIDLINYFQNNINKHIELANNFEKNKNYDSAIYYFKIVDYFIPNRPQILNSLGWLYILNMQYNEALNTLEKAVPLVEYNSDTYTYLIGNLAHSYLLTGNTEKAKSIYYANRKRKIGDKFFNTMVVLDFNKFIEIGIKNDFFVQIAEKLNSDNLLIK